jgi:hypothetical protein
MSQRGRGCLELRPSDSAFYRTTTSEIGHKPAKYDDVDDAENSDISAPVAGSTPQTFAFLYTRESDRIGSMVRNDGLTKMQMTASTIRRGANQNRVGAVRATTNSETVKVSADQILSSYKQGTKIEDPRFTTTSNEYGM